LSACYLSEKIWGESVPLPAIIHRTQNDWKFIKGQVDYADLDNEWVLLWFANCHDRLLVYDQQPWFINGLNFVNFSWAPFFDTCLNQKNYSKFTPKLMALAQIIVILIF